MFEATVFPPARKCLACLYFEPAPFLDRRRVIHDLTAKPLDEDVIQMVVSKSTARMVETGCIRMVDMRIGFARTAARALDTT